MHPTSLLHGAHAYLSPLAALADLDAAAAGSRPAGAPHAIVEIVAHMVFWQDWFLDRTDGIASALPAPAALGWPAVTGRDWHAVADRFTSSFARALAVAAESSRHGERITPPIEFEPLQTYTAGDVLSHIALHNAHHTGQIITIRQQLGTWPPPAGSWTW
jgi:uncharacterized damage-inducible protein DinB